MEPGWKKEERVRTEERLRLAEQGIEAILMATGAGMDFVDSLFRLSFVDNESCKRLGPFQGRTCFDYFLGRTTPCEKCRLAATLATHERAITEVFSPRENRRYEITAVPLRSSDGRRMVCEIRIDITMRKQAEEERTRMEEGLRFAQKAQSIGQLAGGVAHDINNMLSPIIGYADLLLEELAPEQPFHDEIVQIRRSAERVKGLTQQLLAFGRRRMHSTESLDLRSVLREFEPLLRLSLREDIRIQMHLPETLGEVRADPGQLEQILMNLALNAQDAMPRGGELSLTVREEDLDMSAVECRGDSSRRFVILSVSDTGHGMDCATLDKIFEPFFTTKGEGKGTGLGLSIVRGIVKQLDGEVRVRSRVGIGTEFSIYLPRIVGSTGTSRLLSAPETHVTDGKGVVMIVDDSDDVRGIAVRILQGHGYRVLSAGNAEEAAQIMRSEGGAIDLLVADVVMPGMTGKQLFELLSRERQGLKVLYLSGYCESVIAHHGLLHEGAAFLQKPFSMQSLCQKVREALER